MEERLNHDGRYRPNLDIYEEIDSGEEIRLIDVKSSFNRGQIERTITFYFINKGSNYITRISEVEFKERFIFKEFRESKEEEL